MGLASHSECLQTEMLVKKNRSSHRGAKKGIASKKKKRGGEKETPIHFRRKASMLELVRKWLAFASQKNLWVSLTF